MGFGVGINFVGIKLRCCTYVYTDRIPEIFLITHKNNGRVEVKYGNQGYKRYYISSQMPLVGQPVINREVYS